MHSQCLRFICVWFVTSMFDQDKKPCSVTSVTDGSKTMHNFHSTSWFQNRWKRLNYYQSSVRWCQKRSYKESNVNTPDSSSVNYSSCGTSMFSPKSLPASSWGSVQRAQRKHTRQLQRQLFQLWDKYVFAEITASQLLRKCSNIYSPLTISVLDKDLSA
jgi:hypothetical protein